MLERAFKILDVLGASSTSLGLTEIALRADVPKATTYRLLNQLVELRVVERHGEWYRLGRHMFTLGAAVVAQRRLREAALPLMSDLCDSLRQVVHLGVLDNGAVLHIEKVVPRGHRVSRASLGTRRAVHATALGKAILAFLPPEDVPRIVGRMEKYTPYTTTDLEALGRQLSRAREAGFAIEHEEWVTGVNCVGAPILNASRQPIAGLSVSGPISSFTAERAGLAVRTAATEIGAVVAARPWEQ